MFINECEIVCNVDKLKVDIQETICKYKTIKYWVYIKHDKDDTAPHYHIYLNFGCNLVDSDSIAKLFNLDARNVCKINVPAVILLNYLLHRNEIVKHKFQYDIKDLKANFDIVDFLDT